MYINRIFCLLTFAQKRHRKYLNEQDHPHVSNLLGKVGNLLGSFSAELGNIKNKQKLTGRYLKQ